MNSQVRPVLTIIYWQKHKYCKEEHSVLDVSKGTVLEANAEENEDYVSMCIIHFPNQK
jgi:hypothetical protein